MRVASARWVSWCSGSGGTIAHNAFLTETTVTIIIILYLGNYILENFAGKEKSTDGILGVR